MADAATLAPDRPAAQKPFDAKLRWGDINWAAFWHTGATMDGSLVVKGVGVEPNPRSVIERDLGTENPDDNRTHSTMPSTYFVRQSSGGRRLVNSVSPLVPTGTVSEDPSLLVVPYGKYYGLMLGQMTPEEKAEVAATATTAKIKAALKEAAFWPESHAIRPPLREAANGQQTANGQPKVKIGQMDLAAFYHKGSIVQNPKGDRLLVIETWATQTNGKAAARVVPCDASGVPIAGARENMLVSLPASAMAPSKETNWKGTVKILKSTNPQLVEGTLSTDASLLLVPYGYDTGKSLGALNKFQRAELSQTAKSEKFKAAIAEAKNFPGVQDIPRKQRLSEATIKQLRDEQARLLRSIPLVHVIEQFCGLAPDSIEGSYRKYRLDAGIINLNAKSNKFGSLNGYKFSSLRGKEGSSNNAVDMACAVYEMEGKHIDFPKVAKALEEYFHLTPQMDALYEAAVRREADIAAGRAVAPSSEQTAKVDMELKAAAAAQKALDETELPFDLARGHSQNIEGVRYGGGFEQDEALWDKARAYLVNERKLDPHLIDYLHANSNLYAAWRQDPSAPEVIVAPVFGFKTGQCVAVDTKPLPQKPGEKTLGKCYGPVGKGAFMFGTFGDETKHVVLCEGWIKAIAYFELHRKADKIGPETCIMSLAGAKSPTQLIPRLKELGADVVVAFDNEYKGRTTAREFSDECKKAGVPCIERFVEPSEVTFTVEDTLIPGYNSPERGQEIRSRVAKWASDNKVPFRSEATAEDPKNCGIRMPNTEEVILFLETILNEDRKASRDDYQVRAQALRKQLAAKGLNPKLIDSRVDAEVPKHRTVSLDVHSKDWDDVLRKGPFKPTFERKPEPAPQVAPAQEPAAPAAPEPATNSVPEAPLAPEVAAPPAAPEAPKPESSVAPKPTKRPTPRGARMTPALVLVRTVPDAGKVFFVGTALGIHELKLDKEQSVLLGMLVEEDHPRPVVISGNPPQLAGYMNQDGLMVDADGVLGTASLADTSEAIQQSWLHPTKAQNIEQLARLRRASGLPVPPPSPVGQTVKPPSATPQLYA